jgi:aspartyl-tRNA(Asn)/glutamyl-tRNA(Gln) amidotransferase subunit A
MGPLSLSLSLSEGCCGVAELARSFRERQASPIDALATCLQRIDCLNPSINAFITVTRDSATQESERAARDFERGEPKGPLHGVPVAVKDFYDTAGVRTTAGSDDFRNRIPTVDAAAVARLKGAGAVIVGKTNMHALGMGTTGLESAFGPVRNPWNVEFIAGGSSGGSAAAVASGMCCATLDTDAIGSCRLPAACCGVVGFKGSSGLIDLSGVLGDAPPPSEDIRWLSHAGVTARKVEDVAILLDALAGRTDEPAEFSYADRLNDEAKLRVGVVDNFKADRQVTEVFERAAATIGELGFETRGVSAPFTHFGMGVGKIESDRRTVATRCFAAIDLLLLPTVPHRTLRAAEATDSPLALSAAHTMFANYFGLPAISVPCGFDDRGLPLGLQIVGRPWEDIAVLRLAYRYQNATGFAQRRPVVNVDAMWRGALAAKCGGNHE